MPFILSGKDVIFIAARTFLTLSLYLVLLIPLISKLSIPDSMILTDVNVIGLKGEHSWVSDLEVALMHPSGESVILFSTVCGDSIADFNLSFDEESPVSSFTCPPTDGGTYQPLQPFSTLYDREAAGIWQLEIRDLVELDGGKLNAWALELCSRTTTIKPPELIRNQMLEVKRWNSAAITPKELTAGGGISRPEQLIFTLLGIPREGHLSLNDEVLIAGSTFSQKDIDKELLKYHHHGNPSNFDGFRFTLTNEKGGWLGEVRFNIAISGPLKLAEGKLDNKNIFIHPNPVIDFLYVSLPEILNQDVELGIWDIQGRHLFTQKIPTPIGQASRIDISELESGYYFLRIRLGKDSYMHKFIVH